MSVHRVDDDGSTGEAIGQAVLVSSEWAVMEVANRDATPFLPLRILVPAAAGGGRDENTTSPSLVQVDIVGMQFAVNGSHQVALELAPQAPEQFADTEDPSQDPTPQWFCKFFPQLCT